MNTMINEAGKCRYCGGFHMAKCPLVRAIEYFPDGTVKKVEFHAPEPIPIETSVTPGKYETTWR